MTERQPVTPTLDDEPKPATKSARWTQLLLGAARGDRASFDTLVQEAEKDLWFYVYPLVQDKNLADDIVSETFLKVWQNRVNYSPTKANARTWMYLIAHRLALDHIDRRQRQRRHQTRSFSELLGTLRDGEEVVTPELADEHQPNPRDLADQGFVRTLVREALDKLDARDRTALLLFHIEGMSYEEIAQTLECTVPAIGPRLTRAREKLRTLLDPHVQP